jgi:tetratricopeptide (TPR) repeat protein
MTRGHLALALALGCLGILAAPADARAWDWFRAENPDVQRGNALLGQNKPAEALQAFDAAQRSLPNDPGVQLNRGLSLMAAGKLGEAREALAGAAQRANTPELRAKAQYDLGLAFLREADAQAADEAQRAEAQKSLREAVDAFRSSLRSAPGNRDAAWNLELAKRRLVDLEHKQEQEKQKQEQEKQEQEKQEQGEPGDEPKQDEQKPGEQQDKPEQNPDQQPRQDGQGADQQAPKPDQQPSGTPPEPNKPGEAQAPKPAQPPKPEPANPPPAPEPGSAKPLPEDMQRALDALSESDSLQKQRARARARERPQRVEKDW